MGSVISELIESLEAIRKRSPRYVDKPDAHATVYLIDGLVWGAFRHFRPFYIWEVSREVKEQIANERGWRVSNHSYEDDLKKQGWPDEKIIDELLLLEIETWRRIEKSEIEVRGRSVDIGGLISPQASLIGKQACIDGTNVAVSLIARLHKRGVLPEEISKLHKRLTLAGTYAALAYYYANPAEIETNIAKEKEVLSLLAQDLKQPNLVRTWANSQLEKYEDAS